MQLELIQQEIESRSIQSNNALMMDFLSGSDQTRNRLDYINGWAAKNISPDPRAIEFPCGFSIVVR